MNEAVIQNQEKFFKVITGGEYVFRAMEDAKLKIIDIQCGAPNTNSNVTVILEGNGAEAEIWSIFLGGGNERFSIKPRVIHTAQRTNSLITAKGILGGASSAEYGGIIEIRDGAYGARGFERVDTLLISDEAFIKSSPNLEIDHNDISCGHAATTSRISSEKLFYLASRGLNEADAAMTMLDAHFFIVYEAVDDKKVLEKIKNEVKNKLCEITRN